MTTNLLLFFVLPAALSELIRRVAAPRQWRDWLVARANGFGLPSPQAARLGP